MPNIVLTRIDNRLVHGQVATQWCGAIGANLILVANDEVAGFSPPTRGSTLTTLCKKQIIGLS